MRAARLQNWAHYRISTLQMCSTCIITHLLRIVTTKLRTELGVRNDVENLEGVTFFRGVKYICRDHS